MILIDSNIIIYSERKEYSFLRSLFKREDCYVSMISFIEVVGYHKLTEKEKRYFDSLFQLVRQLPVSNEIKLKATEIRQEKKISLGDSIIAATAVTHDLELYTANTEDFKFIKGLKLLIPSPYSLPFSLFSFPSLKFLNHLPSH